MSSRDRPPRPSQVSPFAWWSLGLGALSLLPFLFVYLVPAISGLILGILTLRQVRDWPEAYHGRGLGLAGVIMSLISLGLGITAWVLRAYS